MTNQLSLVGSDLEIEPTGPLSAEEAEQLRSYEATISKGLTEFITVGHALAGVINGRLYRAQYATVDAYLEERWGLSRSYASRLMRSSQVVQNLIDTGSSPAEAERSVGQDAEGALPIGNAQEKPILPRNEAQTRVLAAYTRDEQIAIWDRVTTDYPDPGAITASRIQAVADEMFPKAQKPESDPDAATFSSIEDTKLELPEMPTPQADPRPDAGPGEEADEVAGEESIMTGGVAEESERSLEPSPISTPTPPPANAAPNPLAAPVTSSKTALPKGVIVDAPGTAIAPAATATTATPVPSPAPPDPQKFVTVYLPREEDDWLFEAGYDGFLPAIAALRRMHGEKDRTIVLRPFVWDVLKAIAQASPQHPTPPSVLEALILFRAKDLGLNVAGWDAAQTDETDKTDKKVEAAEGDGASHE